MPTNNTAFAIQSKPLTEEQIARREALQRKRYPDCQGQDCGRCDPCRKQDAAQDGYERMLDKARVLNMHQLAR